MDTNLGAELPDPVDGEAAPEAKSSRGWLALITDAEKTFRTYQDKADNIDKLYADLERMASTTRDRQFQLFWANIAVLGPSVYSRPPVPVVVPRFQDRRPLQRMTSEVLERDTAVTFELEDMDGQMRLVRDDLTVSARGALWVRYETKKESDTETERVCIEHVDRKDFLHGAARNWKEVPWVAKRSYLTRQQMRKRFKLKKADLDGISFSKRRDKTDDKMDFAAKGEVWELWHREKDTVVWVSEGYDKVLDEGEPHLKLEGFFPCPKPAYSTVQRRTLIPVPDMVFYKDQLEEINELTARIAALTDAVKVRGFYPGGSGEIADAIETAIKSTSDNRMLIPIANWAMVGNGKASEMIVWLPIEDVVSAIKELVALRTQIIDDVYQITGLSDIMRGSTEASETLGAQQLKSQYGSIRIRDRQDELVRIARDTARIVAEIMAENFSTETLFDMAQMEAPSDAEINKQVKELEAEAKAITADIKKAATDPEIKAMAAQNPEAAQQAIQQAQQRIQAITDEIGKLKEEPTREKVKALLADQKLRPFMFDIETDSTIAPDENAQKQRATEYLQAMGALLAQALPAIQMVPQSAPLLAETVRFAQGQFRVGRQMDQVVDEFVEKMKALAEQGPAPDPAHAAAAGEKAKAQAEAKAMEADAQAKAMDAQSRQQEAAVKAQAAQFDLQERQVELASKQMLGEQALQASQQETSAKLAGMSAEERRKDQAHGQAMQIGELTIRKLLVEIEGKQQAAENAATLTAAKADAAASKPDVAEAV